MSDLKKHILFYDDTCGLCDRAIYFLVRQDKKKRLLFAPLQGKTAKEKFGALWEDLLKEDSLVMLENVGLPSERYYLRTKAVMRALWHIGRGWSFLGWLSFLPLFLFDPIYRFIAKNRKSLGCPLVKDLHKINSDRFLT